MPGIWGEDGADGLDGFPGLTGPAGPVGAMGPPGMWGEDGADGTDSVLLGVVVPRGMVEIPAGSRPGTSFTFAGTPLLIQPFLNGVALWSQATPGVGEYSMSGKTMTTGDSVVTGDRLWALVWY